MRKFKTDNNRTWLWTLAALAVSVAYFIWIGRLIGFTYAINDDINMRDIASGGYTGTPDAHLIFLLYPWGLLLKGLYLLNSHFDWYGILMVGVHALSLWAMLAAVLLAADRAGQRTAGKSFSPLIFGGLFLLLYTVLWMPQAVRVQFSTCAASSGAAALLWYGLGPSAENRGLARDLVTVLLGAVCLCIRVEVFCLTGAFALVLFLWKEGTGRKRFVGGLRLVLLVACVSALLYGADVMAYRTEDWKAYRAFNVTRSRIYDYYEFPEYGECPERYDAIGITENTVRALRDANMLADDRVTAETFQQLKMLTKEVYEEKNPFRQRLSQCFELVAGQFDGSRYGYLGGFSVFLWLLLLVEIFFLGERKKNILFWLSAVGLQAILWLFLGYGGRLPERVGLCMHILSITAGASLSAMVNNPFVGIGELNLEMPSVRPGFHRCRRRDGAGGPGQCAGERRSFIWRDLCLAGCVLALLSFHTVWENIDQAKGWEDSWKMTEYLEDYCGKHPENFYFADVYSLSAYTDKVSFTAQPDTGGSREKNYMRMGDWMAFSPLAEEKLGLHGISSVTDSFLEKENVYLISRDDNPMDYFRNILWERQENMSWHVVDVLNCGEFHMYVYQFRADGEKVLDYRDFEKVQMNYNPIEAVYGADGDLWTRWNSGEPQKAGMASDIVLGEAHEVSGIRLGLYFYEDHPEKVKIFTSEDGENWTEQPYESVGQIEFFFPEPVKCRNIRLMLEDPESGEGWNWSIYEVEVFVSG